MAYTLRQTVSNHTTSATTLTATFSGAVSAGDMLVVCVRIGAGTNATVSDNVNGAWTRVDQGITYTAIYTYIFQNSAAASAGIMVVTASTTDAAGVIRIICADYGGVQTTAGALEGHAVIDNTNTTSWTTGNTVSVTAGDLIVWFFSDGANQLTFIAGSSGGVAGTKEVEISDAADKNMTMIDILAGGASGIQNGSGTESSVGSGAGFILAFKAATTGTTLPIFVQC